MNILTMINLFTEENLDLWIKLQRNVLFTGKHGVGKTAKVIEAFNRNGLKWMYFSASTMDPFTDFVGIPRVKTDDLGDFMEYVLPRLIAEDNIEAFFFDEFNRAPKRVRNAVMELIQFKSINGKKLNSLKMVWAARNPDDDEDTYDVEKLDPAQIDRFPIECEVPYEIDMKYLTSKYGKDWALAAQEWWKGLDKLKDKVSPRKLDDALSFHKDGGDLAHILPSKLNVSSLRTRLSNGAYLTHFQDLIAKNDKNEITKFLLIENNWNGVLNYIINDSKMYYLLEYAPKDKISNLIRNHTAIYKYVLFNYDKVQVFTNLIDSCLNTNLKDKFTKKLETEILIKKPNHPFLLSVNRNIIANVKKYNLNTTSGRRYFVIDLHKELLNFRKFTLDSFNEEELKFIWDSLAKVANSTHKPHLSKNNEFWSLFHVLLMHENKRNNTKVKTLRTEIKNLPGFNKIYDWKPLVNYGWTI